MCRELIENKTVKKHLDELLEKKEDKKNKIVFTQEQSKELLFEYCDKNGKTPTQNVRYKKTTWTDD